MNKLDPLEFTKKENNLMSNTEDELANSIFRRDAAVLADVKRRFMNQ